MFSFCSPWYDLALCIDNNDNQMTFVGHIVLFVSLVASFAPLLRSGANDATRATNKLYALQKSCDCPIHISNAMHDGETLLHGKKLFDLLLRNPRE